MAQVLANIRVAAHGDIPCLLEAFQGFVALFPGNSRPDGQVAPDLARLIDDPNTDFFVADGDNGGCGGFLQQRYRYSVWLGAEEVNVEDVFVTPLMRGLGLGRAFMEAGLSHARERGCTRATLDVIDTNRVPLALYERMGFTAIRRRKVSEGDSITQGRQLYMVKQLD